MITLDALRNCAVVSPSGCWLKSGVEDGRYGWFRTNGRLVRAHRAAWEAINGPIPNGLYVCHRCNNKRCMNPEHLYLGTPSQNARDAWRDGLVSSSGLPQGPTLINANKTHCIHGHEFTPENTCIKSGGRRHCRACQARMSAECRKRKAAALTGAQQP